jgi:hypothetical protein
LDKQTFINQIYPLAIDNYKKYGVLPSLTISQAALESGWGESGLTKKSNNLFGIKGVGTIGSVELPTQEYENGKYVNTLSFFRSYNSWEESITDYGKLLSGSRYKNVIAAPNYKAAALAVKDAGYATSPTYSNSIISLIEENQLYKYDEAAKTNFSMVATNVVAPSILSPNPAIIQGGGSEGGALSVLNPLNWFSFIREAAIKMAFFIPAMILLAIGIYMLFSDQINTAVKAAATGGTSLIADAAKGGKKK